MRKAQIVSFLFVLTFILIAGVVGSNQANAVVCPAGYVCTPTSQTTVACPAGYICEPIKPAPVVITGLTYKKEDGSEIKWCYSITKNLGELDGAPGYESTGADVVALQSQLISLGYDIPSVSSGGSARGQFDEDTKKSVMKYQASKGIPSTGYVGPLTRASLNGLCNAKNSVGSNEYGFWTKAYYSNGKLNISWTSSSLNFDYYQVVLGNSFLNKEIQLGANFAKTQTSYIANIPTEFADFVKLNSKGQDAFYAKVNTIKSDSVSGYTVSTAKSELFTISPGTSPSPTPSTGAASIKVLSPNGGELLNQNETYKITWSYSGLDNSDLIIIGFRTPANSACWIGKVSVYPNSYSFIPSQVICNSTMNGGISSLKNRGQFKATLIVDKFGEGRSVTDMSDELFTIASTNPECPAGYKCSYSVTSPSPTPTNTPAQPAVSFTYPRYAETWYLGETKNVSWTYSNFDSYTNGDKFVELQLIPQDGRAPVVLGTYTAPYGYQPLTIYTKTSTGRDAWLPGEYKLRLVCRATNIEGFRNCRSDAVGYITVKAPMPTPTSTPVSVNPSKDLNAAIWSAVEEYSRGR